MTAYKRRLIPIVDRAFQFKYTALIMGVAAVISAALGYFLLDAYTELNSMIEISDAIGDQLNDDDARRVFYLVVGFLGAEVVILGALGLIITHRVVGPIFVLQRHLETINAGKFPSLRPLRSGDEFSACFAAFSTMVSTQKDRDQREAAVLQDAMDAMSGGGSLDQAQRDALSKMLQERQARLNG